MDIESLVYAIIIVAIFLMLCSNTKLKSTFCKGMDPAALSELTTLSSMGNL